MALTIEQQGFVEEVGVFKSELNLVLKESKELQARMKSIIKRFNRVDKIIQDMANERL